MDEKSLKIPFKAALKPEDSETQTYGCRQNNPSICKNNGLFGVCAFVNDDCICRKPSAAWRKQYNKLKGE